ncbi:MAG: UDP-N-acetylmuramoyl-L-alanyl-D-glutamate--2,6-diaminopimelate ligase [Holosporaceae bacterium]|jgi:UDP-N-acetylmuramoyl-L-alanyl-D-glutamate--2,6-diaminopimelate ligase|nr:UDP-N-acetylmuramoyl-L-alanyl-D-glutamate--2,6-diaminopimelate ligase [Holosporaceae bacterium]
MKTLGELFDLGDVHRTLQVMDLCDNSQNITVPKSMFVALNRNLENRKNHVAEAISRGAEYILQGGEGNYLEIRDGILFLFTPNVRIKLANIAAKFFLSRFDNAVAVTGTNGKSSVVDILRQIWVGSGIAAASIGTLGVITKDTRSNLPHNMTTPDCLTLHKILHRLGANMIENIALEATSHGIEQRRLDEIGFNVCAFTNLTQDHLDHHKTFEKYWNAKARLFTELALGQSTFIVNADDSHSQRIREIARNRGVDYLDYGYSATNVKIIHIDQKESVQLVKCSFFGKEFTFVLPLQGTFQVYNSLCSAAIAHITGVARERAVEELEKLKPINGRLELIAKFRSASIYTDYAHTPDALENAIASLRSHTKNRLITVFGCGGNRDSQKRPLMGEIAEKFADLVIVTDDNPRDEDPWQIRKMILEGCSRATEIGDRRTAIKTAMEMLSEGDTLLVSGKGHETYQQIGEKLLVFSDKDVILDRLKEKQ